MNHWLSENNTRYFRSTQRIEFGVRSVGPESDSVAFCNDILIKRICLASSYVWGLYCRSARSKYLRAQLLKLNWVHFWSNASRDSVFWYRGSFAFARAHCPRVSARGHYRAFSRAITTSRQNNKILIMFIRPAGHAIPSLDLDVDGVASTIAHATLDSTAPSYRCRGWNGVVGRCQSFGDAYNYSDVSVGWLLIRRRRDVFMVMIFLL